MTYLFIRDGGFYPLDLSGDDEARENAELNPGTLRVTLPTGEIIWPVLSPLERAAVALSEFLRLNCPPPEVIGTQDAEWPISIAADNDDDAKRLVQLLTTMESLCVERGLMSR